MIKNSDGFLLSMYNPFSTVAALSTPGGRGALAVIRITGSASYSSFSSIIKEIERFKNCSAKTVHLYSVIDGDDSVVDEITAIKYTGPKSFTGEDMVEIMCHGGPVIIKKILERLYAIGVEPAAKGEFTRRAFLNGKMDLLKAESIRSLIDSNTDIHLRSAQKAYQGKQRESVEYYRNTFIDLLSTLESRIEFEEEDDIREGSFSEIETFKNVIQKIEKEIFNGERVKSFDQGFTVALAGPANAGKSSLFNTILGYERSIVHDMPGTTRDSVSEQMEFNGTVIRILDCAGLRDTTDIIEQKGISITKSALQRSHAVIWVTSSEEKLQEDEKKEILEVKGKILLVLNKMDICSSEEKRNFCKFNKIPFVEVSIKEGNNLNELFDSFSKVINGIVDEIECPDLITNDRHLTIIKSVHQETVESLKHIDRIEIAAHYLKKAMEALEELCGYTTSEEVLNNVFGKFCIGK